MVGIQLRISKLAQTTSKANNLAVLDHAAQRGRGDASSLQLGQPRHAARGEERVGLVALSEGSGH
jgi:hypothetical protein